MSEWKSFLIENGAEFENDRLCSFGSPDEEKLALRQGTVLIDLSDRGFIKVSGEDAESFLQNQLTNDIRNVAEPIHQLSAWCSPKGRIIANFRVFKHQESYILSVSSDLLEHVIKKLSMYVMMSKVTIEDASDSLISFGLAGEKSADELQSILNKDTGDESLQISNTSDQLLCHKNLSILCLTDSLPRFEIIGGLDDAKELWELCSRQATAVTNDIWHYLDIIAGLPQITRSSSEKWIPQMVNYIAIGGVDFKKGCYPGQEVVARLNYLGKTKRRMYHLLIDNNELPAVNETLSSEAASDAGKILNAVVNQDGRVEALAILKIAEVEKALTLSVNENNAKVTLLDLPYSVEE